MQSYNRNSRSGGGRRSGGPLARRGGGDFSGRDSGSREMHKAICDECGKSCEVPFRPRGDKPIYCSDCFERRGGGSSNRSSRRGSEGSNKQLLEQVTSLNTKLDRIISLLEGSVEKKPVSKKANSKNEIENPEHGRRKIETKKASKEKLKKSTKKKIKK
ncbi:hypothetical protein IID22_04255 [Patescibacteria group bacterium]|nr:hypothetical protein [Patescibacteria group bacterium]